MKAGDLVKFCNSSYNVLLHNIGILIQPHPSVRGGLQGPCNGWIVMVGGEVCSYIVPESEIEVINESR